MTSLLVLALYLLDVIWAEPVVQQIADGIYEEIVTQRAYTDYRYPNGRFWLEVHYGADNVSIEFCKIISDIPFIQDQLNKSVPFIDITPEEMQYYFEDCNNTSSRLDGHKTFLEKFTHMFSLKKLSHFATVPGTKWCGMGNTARHYEDLGEFWGVDLCCRDHDHTVRGEYILSNSMSPEHNLMNEQIYTMTRCDKDTQFRQCLLKEGSTTALVVEQIYFNILGSKCFQKSKPAKCAVYNGKKTDAKNTSLKKDRSCGRSLIHLKQSMG